jgi:hypothetical protein
MDDVVLELGRNDPDETLNKADKILAKYGLELSRKKCKFTSEFRNNPIEFMNLPL